MRFIFLALILAIALASVDQPFTGIRVTLTYDKMLKNNKEMVELAINNFCNTPKGTINMTEEVFLITFNIMTHQIKVVNRRINLEKKKRNYKDGVLVVNYIQPFEIKYEFLTSVTAMGAHITYGMGSAIINGLSVILTQNFKEKIPNNEISANVMLGTVTFNGGIYSEAVIILIKKQLHSLYQNLTEVFTEYIKKIDALQNVEEFVQEHNIQGKLVNIKREKVRSSHETNNLHRFVDSVLTINGREIKPNINCEYKKTKESTSEMCFCSHLFPEILVAGDVETLLDLTKWELKGRVMELYGIIPELIDYYSPDEEYKVFTRAIEVGSSGSKSLLTKKYEFKIRGKAILTVNTVFALTLEGLEENNEFFVNQTSAEINSVTTSVIIKPSGKTMLARFMIYEINRMTGKKMFSKGIKIHKTSNSMLKNNATNSFCVLL